MTRRAFIGTLPGGLLAAPLAAEAGKIYRIGALTPFSASDGAPYVEAFRQGLRELGDVEGQNITIDWRGADGKPEQFPDLARELVRLRVHIIVAANNPAIAAAQRATSAIPIVMK